MAKLEELELLNAVYDSFLHALKTTDVGTDDQTIVDEAVAGTTYVGKAGRGIATSTTGWLLTKIVESGTTTTITHAVDSWDNRATASYT